MKYCSDCGGPLRRKSVARNDRERLVCTQCARVHYENPKVLVICMITCGEKLLMVRRATPPQVGLWAPPSGFVELGESLDVAAAREVYEETGVEVDPHELDLHVVANLPLIGEIYVSFRGAVSSDYVRPGVESQECGFYAARDIPWDRLAFPQMAGYVKRFFHESGRGRFSVHYSCTDEHGLRMHSYAAGPRRARYEAAAAFRPFPKCSYYEAERESEGGSDIVAKWRKV